MDDFPTTEDTSNALVALVVALVGKQDSWLVPLSATSLVVMVGSVEGATAAVIASTNLACCNFIVSCPSSYCCSCPSFLALASLLVFARLGVDAADVAAAAASSSKSVSSGGYLGGDSGGDASGLLP
jgi:hypothetical protein